MFIKIPDYISLAINMLNSSGHKAYIVGGCVRDALLGKEPNDWDICTSALPEETMAVFKDYKLVTSGIKHGTVCVIINHLPVEITTFRIDGEYKDNRRPDDVTFTPSLAEDLKRRDFTINAMAYSDADGLIDLNGGTEDLKNEIICCVGNPETRFDEDALRIMRALRFSAQLGFKIELKTKEAIFKKSTLLQNISAERITDEFVKLIESENYFDILTEYEAVFKEFLPIFSVPQPINISQNLILRLSYVLSKTSSENLFGRLKLPKSVSSAIKATVCNEDYAIPETKQSVKLMLNRFGAELTSYILEFKSLLGEDVKPALKVINEIIDNNECYCVKQLDINGNDIIELGFKGNEIGDVLNNLLDAVINENVANKKHDLILYIKNKRAL